MPRKHQKGDVSVPAFHASGTGRDLYLDPNFSQAANRNGVDQLKAAPIRYTDIETGEQCTLRWYTRLPAGAEYKSRLKRQKAMANRFHRFSCTALLCALLNQC